MRLFRHIDLACMAGGSAGRNPRTSKRTNCASSPVHDVVCGNVDPLRGDVFGGPDLSAQFEGERAYLADLRPRRSEPRYLQDKLVRLQTALTDPDPEHVPTQWIDVSTNDIVDR